MSGRASLETTDGRAPTATCGLGGRQPAPSLGLRRSRREQGSRVQAYWVPARLHDLGDCPDSATLVKGEARRDRAKSVAVRSNHAMRPEPPCAGSDWLIPDRGCPAMSVTALAAVRYQATPDSNACNRRRRITR
jgi:hypothetical protein